jgi:hypothetical protein
MKMKKVKPRSSTGGVKYWVSPTPSSRLTNARSPLNLAAMHSMTGFGRGSAATDAWHATVEISSVNRKQAELVIQTPRELNELEARIRNAVLAVVSRGRIQVSIKLERAQGAATDFKINPALALAFSAALAELGATIGQPIWGWFSQSDQFAMGPAYQPRPDIGRMLIGTPSILALTAADAGISVTADAGIDAIAETARLPLNRPAGGAN